VMQDPVQVCCNHHTYCRGCIAQAQTTSNLCPECRVPISREEPARLARNMILLLDVRCPHAGCNGGGSPSSVSAATSCGWTGPMKNYEAHLSACPFGEISCPFAEAGCAFRAARRDMGAHSSDAAAHLLLLMTSFAAVKAEGAAVKAECAAVKAEGAVIKAECASAKAENGVMKSDIRSLQRYVSILYTTGDEAAAGGMEWVITNPIISADGEVPAYTYTGQMREGECHGFGRASYGRVEGGQVARASWESYDGQWKEGRWHGQGILKTGFRDIYIGQWKNHQMHGQGICKWSNGDIHEGGWEEGSKQGQFIFTEVGGTRYKQVYEEDVMTSNTPIV
jgi:hypothetical protein